MKQQNYLNTPGSFQYDRDGTGDVRDCFKTPNWSEFQVLLAAKMAF
jgi:hypothetical protein